MRHSVSKLPFKPPSVSMEGFPATARKLPGPLADGHPEFTIGPNVMRACSARAVPRAWVPKRAFLACLPSIAQPEPSAAPASAMRRPHAAGGTDLDHTYRIPSSSTATRAPTTRSPCCSRLPPRSSIAGGDRRRRQCRARRTLANALALTALAQSACRVRWRRPAAAGQLHQRSPRARGRRPRRRRVAAGQSRGSPSRRLTPSGASRARRPAGNPGGGDRRRRPTSRSHWPPNRRSPRRSSASC